MYMIMGRCLKGVHVAGYVVKRIETGEMQILSKAETERLVMLKLVANCTGQIYDGKVVLKGLNCKLVDLPNYSLDGKLIKKDKELVKKDSAYLAITARIVEGKNTIGYVIYGLGNNGEHVEKKIEREKVLLLAREGKISNARVQKLNDKMLLRGVNCELAQLPVVRI